MTKKKNWTIIALIILVIVQWAIPGSMIREREIILRKGKTFRFLTEPVDPEDPIRGRYITLGFQQNKFPVKRGDKYMENGKEVYALLDNDTGGFARVTGLSSEKPGSEKDFVKVKVSGFYNPSGDMAETHFDYPFEKFYLDEFKASGAETAYRNANRTIRDTMQNAQKDTTQKTFAVVNILDGEAVIRDVIINGKPIRELSRQPRP